MLHSGGVNVFIVYNVSIILITIVTLHYSISMWVLANAGFFFRSNGGNFPDDENLSWLDGGCIIYNVY